MSVETNKASWLVGSGEGMSERIRAHDWSATPLGPIDAWSPGLRVAVNLMLANGFPGAIAWGPGAIVLYNDGYAGIIGSHHPDALGQSVHSVFPEVRDAYGPVLDRVWHGETVTQYDQPYRLWRNDRLDEAWFTVSFSPLFDERGQVGGVLSTLFETTDRLLAEWSRDDIERELRERERRYHTLFDAMEEGVGIIERIDTAPGQPINFRCVLGNPVFATLSGVDDAVGQTMRDVLPGEPDAWFDTYDAVLRTGEPVRFERDLVTIGRLVDVYAFRIDDGDQRRVGIVIRDITARNQAVAALHASRADLERQERFHDATLSNVDDFIYMWDRDNRFIYANRALERLWDLTRDEFLGKTPAELGYPPELCALFARQVEHVFVTGETVTGEVPYTNTRGVSGYYDYKFSPVAGNNGEIEFVVGSSRDVTERRRAEAERERLLREVDIERARLVDVFEHAPSMMVIHRGPDHVVEQANAFYRQWMGNRELIGRSIREVLPDIEGQGPIEALDVVYTTGEPKTMSGARVVLDRGGGQLEEHYLDFVLRALRNPDGEITGVFGQGVPQTERIRAESALRASEARQAFLLKLSDALRPLAEPAEIQAKANRILGEYLQVDRAFYVEVDLVNQVSIVEQDYVRGNVPSLAGRHALADYAPVVDVMREGRPMVVADVETAPMIAASQRPTYAALPIRSFMVVPIIKDGDYVAVMATTDVNPRAWTAEDLTLLQDVAERTWAAVERARAEATLRQNEERQAILLRLSDALRPLADPGEIQAAALNLLGEHLGVDRAFYTEIVTDGGIDYYRLDREYRTPGTPSIVGRHPVSAFGHVVTDTYRAGRRMAVPDVESDEALATEDRQAFAAIGVHAFIGVPLIKDGRFVAALGVNQSQARAWTGDDVRLVEDTAERTWAAVERARAEAALRENENRLQKAMSTDTVGVLYFDLHGRLTDANGTFERMSGYSREDLREIVHWAALTPPEFVDVTERMAGDLAAHGKASPYEKQMIRKDGSRWWGLFAPTRLSGSGRDSMCVEFIINITPRKRAEEALRQSEERYRTLFESIDQGFCTIEVLFNDSGAPVDYRFLEVNPVFARNTGLTDAVGKCMRELRPGHEQFWFDAYGRIARTGVAERFEEYAHELSRWYNVYAYRVGKPEQHRVAVLFEDITGRKQAELAVHESRAELERQAQFLDATLSNVGDYISIWDRQARYVYANRVLERLWGRTRLAYAGKTTAELGYTPDQVAFFERSIAEVLRTRRVVTGEIPYTSLVGETGYYEIVFSPVTGLGPRPEFVVGVSRDITGLKRREAQAAFLADVSNDFARLTSTDDIMRVVGEKIYQYFGLDRLAFAAVDEVADTVTSIHDRHADGLPPAEGVLRLSEYIGDAFLRRLRTGEVYALHDVTTDPYAAGRADAFRALDAGSLLFAPFVSEGAWRFVIVLQKIEPHAWQQAEIELIQAVAPRLYLAIERARATAAIRESEGRFRAVANLVPDLLWSTDATGRTTWYSQRLLDYAGASLDDMVDLGWNGVIHPDDLAPANQAFFDAIAAGSPFHHEHRLRRHDGDYRWFLLRAEPIHDVAGIIVQWFGAATDIHETRLVRDELSRRVAIATTELRMLSRQLILVQEEERRHLARELHDEIGQALTALSLQISAARRGPATGLSEAEDIVHELTGRVSQLSMDLRPAALDTLGLIPALLWHSQRYEARTGVRVDLRHHGLDRRLPPEVEISTYRVVQEALTNVARHSGADTVTVQLLADDRLTIVIRDQGHGFDTATTSAAGGLGGMRERVELLGGGFWIEAADGAGVVVTAEIPLDPASRLMMENR